MATALLAGIKAQERRIEELDQMLGSLTSDGRETSTSEGSPTSLNAWSVDQQSGKVNVSFFGDLNLQGNSLLDVKKITGYLGKWSMDENGDIVANKVTAKEVDTEKLCVGGVCVTKDEFMKVFSEGSSGSSTSAVPPSTADVSPPTNGSTDIEVPTNQSPTTNTEDTAQAPSFETGTSTDTATTTELVFTPGAGQGEISTTTSDARATSMATTTNP